MKSMFILMVLIVGFVSQSQAMHLCNSQDRENDPSRKAVRIAMQFNVYSKQSGDTDYTEHSVVSGMNVSGYQYYISSTHPGELMMELFEDKFNAGVEDYIDGQVRFMQNQYPINIRCYKSTSIDSVDSILTDFFSEI